MPSASKARLALLASGAGSNADVISAHFSDHPSIGVGLVVTNNPQAGVIGVAARHGLKTLIVPRGEWRDPAEILRILAALDVTHIVLAGFLQLIHADIIRTYPGRIVNIHPALLPDFGGKGMYGHHVHAAVKSAGRTVTGITIHEVNERYDEGRILFQAQTPLTAEDTPDTIAAKVHALEHRHYPEVIEQWITG
jgi:phosphoribosylglycinamide formyltransferase-1